MNRRERDEVKREGNPREEVGGDKESSGGEKSLQITLRLRLRQRHSFLLVVGGGGGGGAQLAARRRTVEAVDALNALRRRGAAGEHHGGRAGIEI